MNGGQKRPKNGMCILNGHEEPSYGLFMTVPHTLSFSKVRLPTLLNPTSKEFHD